MKKRLQKKRAEKGLTKAQLQRRNGLLEKQFTNAAHMVRLYSEKIATAERKQIAAERQRDMALQIITELQPELADLLQNEMRLRQDPGYTVMRSLKMRPIRDLIDEASFYEPAPIIEHWITRMRMWVETNPERGRILLCFRLRRPEGKDTLGWQAAFDDMLVHRSPTALRLVIMDLAKRLCNELEHKLAR